MQVKPAMPERANQVSQTGGCNARIGLLYRSSRLPALVRRSEPQEKT